MNHPEDAIHASYTTGDMDMGQAIHALVALGYLYEDAEDMVLEWHDEWRSAAHEQG